MENRNYEQQRYSRGNGGRNERSGSFDQRGNQRSRSQQNAQRGRSDRGSSRSYDDMAFDREEGSYQNAGLDDFYQEQNRSQNFRNDSGRGQHYGEWGNDRGFPEDLFSEGRSAGLEAYSRRGSSGQGLYNDGERNRQMDRPGEESSRRLSPQRQTFGYQEDMQSGNIGRDWSEFDNSPLRESSARGSSHWGSAQQRSPQNYQSSFGSQDYDSQRYAGQIEGGYRQPSYQGQEYRGSGYQQAGRASGMHSGIERSVEESGRGRRHWSNSPYERFQQHMSERGEHYGKGPKGYRHSDEEIKREVCTCLARHHEIDASDIEVDVKGGEVTLSGFVDSRQTKYLVEDVIEDIMFVSDVNNQIRVRKENSNSSQNNPVQTGGLNSQSSGADRTDASQQTGVGQISSQQPSSQQGGERGRSNTSSR